MTNYSHLKINVSNEFKNKVKNKLPLGKLPKFYFFFRILYNFKIFRKISRIIVDLENYRNINVKETQSIIDKSKENYLLKNNLLGNEFESNFGYDEFQEVKGIFHYYEQIQNNFKAPKYLTESKVLYENIIDLCSKDIKEHNIKNFTNFGSYLSYTDSILAEKFKETKFYCADRSLYTKKINEFIYGHIKNMKFIDGDIFKFLENKFQNSLFFSARTALIMPKFFLEKLYQSVYNAEYEYVVLFEQIGFSHETLDSYDFSDDDKPSVAYRWGMHLHNYPGILNKCGYEVLNSKLIKTDHPFEDYRFLYILAKRK